MQKITPFLWYDKEAGEAAKLYVSVFKDARITSTTVAEGSPGGKVEIVSLELFGQEVTLMGTARPATLKFNESFSFTVSCEDQAEVDEYWSKLTANGGSEIECGWLKDKFGLCWQITPKRLTELMTDPDRAKAGRVMQAMLKMKKIIIADLEAAAKG